METFHSSSTELLLSSDCPWLYWRWFKTEDQGFCAEDFAQRCHKQWEDGSRGCTWNPHNKNEQILSWILLVTSDLNCRSLCSPLVLCSCQTLSGWNQLGDVPKSSKLDLPPVSPNLLAHLLLFTIPDQNVLSPLFPCRSVNLLSYYGLIQNWSENTAYFSLQSYCLSCNKS